MQIYNQIFTCKNNTQIPLFSSGKSFESKYNPQAEAEKKLLNTNINSSIVIIFGIGSGIFIDLLSDKNQQTLFLAVEYSEDDINFLSQFDSVKKIKQKKNVIVLSQNELISRLPQIYIPSLYGNIQFIEQIPWINENIENFNLLIKKINESLKITAADFSVQSHFGKIWQYNINKNLINFIKLQKYFNYSFDNTKNAYIVAAGPSLDKTINILQKDSNAFIISTDTGFQTLLKNNLTPDIVVSIDGQNVSYNHFVNIKNSQKTLFIFDICGNSSAIEKILENGNKIYFINSGHPFINYLNFYNQNCIPTINTGSGTVTIAALDIAIKMGFYKINILGADFSYIDGKAYAKGTYLDSLYQLQSYHLENRENFFNKLQYRTELIKISEKKFTTEILNSYKNSLEDFIKSINCSISKTNEIYEIINETKQIPIQFSKQKIDYKEFCNKFSENYSKIDFKTSFIPDLLNNPIILSLLPYISYLRIYKLSEINTSDNLSISEFSNLAYKNIVRYNEVL